MAENRPIFVISDLHMGDGGDRDNFALDDREQQLHLLLDDVAAQHGELVVLGDLFEFWQMNLSKIIVTHRPLLDRLAAMNALYVLGNHDADLKHFIATGLLPHPFFQRMCGPFERQIGGKRIKFMHGHEVDPFNSSDVPGWGRIFCIVAGMLEDDNKSPLRKNGDFVEDDFEAIGDRLLDRWSRFTSRMGRLLPCRRLGAPLEHLTPAQNPGRIQDFLAMYQQDRKAEGYDVAVVGHTHQAGRSGDWYFNSGTWARKTNNFVQVSPAGDASVFDWVDGRPVPNHTALQM
jgi:UDP-2,3-diacylglucosamine pyrophosphatase LpxH